MNTARHRRIILYFALNVIEEQGIEDIFTIYFMQISGVSEQSDTEEEIARLSFTLKQLIRKLHVTEPVEHVMCLIGKK